jgi:diaminopimelate decarboxylase
MSEVLAPHIWPDSAAIHDGRLFIAGCDTAKLAMVHGTPLYTLCEHTLRGAMQAYRDAFAAAYPAETRVHYAGKAFLNTALAQIVAQEGLGLDVVSDTELFVAQRAGLPMERVHCHGNAKTRAELERALSWGVGAIIVDNFDELEQLVALSSGRQTAQAVLLRVAPGIDAQTHAHIATGGHRSKFGLPLEAVDAAARQIQAAPGLRLIGLHAHIGSQIFDPAELEAGITVLLDLAARLREQHDVTIEEISPGGGLGVPYTAEMPATDIAAYAQTLAQAVQQGCTALNLPLPRLTVEPGRSIIARAGVALYQIVGRKRDPHTVSHLHIDGGMADNIRPALYNARYTALVANRAADAPVVQVDVAGRFCESGDLLLQDVALPAIWPGDLLAVAVSGAYTLSMASNYNLVPRPALLLLRDGEARLIQRRETEEDLVARDLVLE